MCETPAQRQENDVRDCLHGMRIQSTRRIRFGAEWIPTPPGGATPRCLPDHFLQQSHPPSPTTDKPRATREETTRVVCEKRNVRERKVSGKRFPTRAAKTDVLLGPGCSKKTPTVMVQRSISFGWPKTTIKQR